MKSLWEILWDYDPNALVVMDKEFVIQVVNPAFCEMFQMSREEAIGRHGEQVFGDMSIFHRMVSENLGQISAEQEIPQHGLFVRNVIFSIPDESLVACIMVDLRQVKAQHAQLNALKKEAILEVKQVVDRQMTVAQEIAGLLGETTAETKVSLLKLLEMLEQES